jgi:CRP-like cAMP-binding protein
MPAALPTSAAAAAAASALLRKVPLFARLDEDALRRLARHMRRRTFRAGETIVYTGDPGHTLYVILSGSVKICRTTADGDRTVIALLGPGKFFGEMSLLDGQPRSADALVAETAEIVMLARDDFESVLRENVDVALDLLAVMAERLRRTNDAVNVSSGLSIGGRVARQLLELAEMYGEPFGPPGGNERRLKHKLTQQEIAEMVGCTRESVNKALAGLRREKAVAIGDDGHLILRKPALLQRRASGG